MNIEKEREAFEAWLNVKSEDAGITMSTLRYHKGTENERYMNLTVQKMWSSWAAAAYYSASRMEQMREDGL